MTSMASTTDKTKIEDVFVDWVEKMVIDGDGDWY